MRLFTWLKSRSSDRGRGLWLYKRGMAKAKKRDHKGAIDDYTATIDMDGIPADVKAMALYNRGVVHAAAGNNPKAIDDLNAVLAMAEPLENVKTAAKQKLVRMERRSCRKGPS
jgi:tetratricopeptide (TPR) repeat protein